MKTHTDLLDEKGLPANLDAERFVLGSILLRDEVYIQVAPVLRAEDFSIEKHRRIYARMKDLADRGEHIDRVTLAEELNRTGQLESVDGLSYLVSLDQGIPEIANIDAYVNIVRERLLREGFFTSGLWQWTYSDGASSSIGYTVDTRHGDDGILRLQYTFTKTGERFDFNT